MQCSVDRPQSQAAVEGPASNARWSAVVPLEVVEQYGELIKFPTIFSNLSIYWPFEDIHEDSRQLFTYLVSFLPMCGL